MFGYVTADFRLLSKQAKAEYKAAYCGLCRTLAQRYSAKARFLLSFDTAFALAVISELQNDKACKICACPYHLGRKRACRTGSICDRAADATVLLACLNFEDDIKDGRSPRAYLLRRLFRKDFEKAKANAPELFDALLRGITDLERAEKFNVCDPDIPADIFGKMLAAVFSQDERLEPFGYYLGRFIYLCDAVCDFKADLRRGRYNPLVSMRTSEFEDMLAFNAEKCQDIIAQLGIQNELISNVLEHGIWLRYSIKYKRTV